MVKGWLKFFVSSFKKKFKFWIFCLSLVFSISCTDNISATLPPSPIPSPNPISANVVPEHLKNIFLARCGSCHGEKGDGGEAGTIYQARSRSPKNWTAFLKNPKSINKNSKKLPVEGLTEAEYAAFGEWLARITKENRYDTVGK